VKVRIATTVFDCADPRALAEFWSAVTGFGPPEGDDRWVVLREPGGSRELAFQRVPEPKSVKNRVHLDLAAADEEAAARWAEGLGATRLWVSENPDDVFITLADPDGNEFCFIREEP
jgi:glyoxalase superfamily protein